MGSTEAHFVNVQIQNTIDSCWLREVNFIWPKFTWIYQRRDGYQIRERLDRALVSLDWAFLFPSTKLFHRSSSTSGHNPLLLNFFSRKKKKLKRVFRFESMWLKDQRCKKVVSNAWNECLVGDSAFRCME